MDITKNSLIEARKKRFVTSVLSVFGDESSDEKGKRIFAVAGIIGTQEEWDVLEPIWRKCTDGKIFHAADCEAGYGVYKGIPRDDRHKEYKKLTQILIQTNMMGFGVAVDVEAFKKFVPDAVEGAPYYHCFMRVVMNFAKTGYLSIPQQKVNFIFDRNVNTNYNSVYLVEYLSMLSEQYEYASYINRISFASRNEVGIQAADLLARETMKHYDNEFGPIQRTIRRSMNALLSTKRYKFHYYHKDYFEWFAKNLEVLKQKSGLDFTHYEKWLKDNKLIDNASNKTKYLIYLESIGK